MLRKLHLHSRALVLLAAVLSLAGALRADSGRPNVALDGWFEARSRNLRLITDLEQTRAIDLLQQLEALRSSLANELLGGAETRRLPTTVVTFADNLAYESFRVAGREGQFYSTLFESLIVLNGDAGDRPLPMAAAHEYTHALVTEFEIRLPLWVHEGLAEYYSTFLLSDGVVAVGRSVPGHRSLLRNRAFLPFEELVATDGRSSGYYGRAGARFYAQSWLTVHYLLSDAGCSIGLDELVRNARLGSGSAGTLSRLTGLSTGELDRQLRRYLNRESIPVMLYPLAGADSLATEVRPLTESEAAYQLGVVALEQARRNPERRRLARELFEASLALDPTRGDAHAGLAGVEALAGRLEAALERFERAVFLDALEGRSYAYYGQHLAQRSREGGAGVSSRNASEMLARALEFEPGHRRIAERLEQIAAAPAGAPPLDLARPPTPPI